MTKTNLWNHKYPVNSRKTMKKNLKRSITDVKKRKEKNLN